MKELLIKLKACSEAREWAENKSWEEVYNTCHRGDWLLWLFKKTNPDDLQLLTLAKGHCANTVRHLMKDERSIKAVDVAITFGEGKATREDADATYAAAYAAFAAASADADAAAYAAAAATYAVTAAADVAYDAYAAADAAYAAAYAAADAADAADAAAAAADAAYAATAAAYAAAYAAYATADAAKKYNQQLTADICRMYLPIEIWNIS
jgi:hypothetical protein